jgi:hypothetical protein
MLLHRFHLPIFLSAVQFFASSMIPLAWLTLKRRFRPIPGEVRSYLLIVALASTAASVLTNYSYDTGTVAFTEALKSNNLSFLLSSQSLRAVLSTGRGAAAAGLSLLAHAAGWVQCYYSSSSSSSSSVAGIRDAVPLTSLLAALAASLCCSCRTAFAHSLCDVHASAFEDLNLFAAFSIVGLLVSVCLLVLESPKILRVLVDENSNYYDYNLPMNFVDLPAGPFSLAALVLCNALLADWKHVGVCGN